MAINDLRSPRNETGNVTGQHNEFRPMPTWIDSFSLGINTAETYTVPATAKYLVLSGSTDFYARSEGTAAATIDVTTGVGSERNPTKYLVEGGESLSLISPAACLLTIAVYS